MTLSAEQKQALREKAASAKTQSKLPGNTPPAVLEALEQIEQAEQDVLRETYLRIPTEGVDMLADERVGEFEESPTVDDVPWDVDTPSSNRSLTIRPIETPAIVEGFRVEDNMTLEQVEDLTEQVYTYIGVEPRHIGQYTGRKLRMIGSVAVPLEGEVTDKPTGEVHYVKWVQPRFKLASIDDVTGEHVILYGGGKNGLAFVRLMTSLYGPGDWRTPKEVTVTMQVRDNAHVLYHFMHKRVKDE